MSALENLWFGPAQVQTWHRRIEDSNCGQSLRANDLPQPRNFSRRDEPISAEALRANHNNLWNQMVFHTLLPTQKIPDIPFHFRKHEGPARIRNFACAVAEMRIALAEKRCSCLNWRKKLSTSGLQCVPHPSGSPRVSHFRKYFFSRAPGHF